MQRGRRQRFGDAVAVVFHPHGPRRKQEHPSGPNRLAHHVADDPDAFAAQRVQPVGVVEPTITHDRLEEILERQFFHATGERRHHNRKSMGFEQRMGGARLERAPRRGGRINRRNRQRNRIPQRHQEHPTRKETTHHSETLAKGCSEPMTVAQQTRDSVTWRENLCSYKNSHSTVARPHSFVQGS
jgi:hypothetical protein